MTRPASHGDGDGEGRLLRPPQCWQSRFPSGPGDSASALIPRRRPPPAARRRIAVRHAWVRIQAEARARRRAGESPSPLSARPRIGSDLAPRPAGFKLQRGIASPAQAAPGPGPSPSPSLSEPTLAPRLSNVIARPRRLGRCFELNHFGAPGQPLRDCDSTTVALTRSGCRRRGSLRQFPSRRSDRLPVPGRRLGPCLLRAVRRVS